MIEDTEFSVYWRLAYVLKRPVSEILRLPYWEIQSWRYFFDLFGPLDWRRDDLMDARQTYLQTADHVSSLRDFVLFPEPEIIKELTEDEMTEKLDFLQKNFGSES